MVYIVQLKQREKTKEKAKEKTKKNREYVVLYIWNY
jgi:hypothetical protein